MPLDRYQIETMRGVLRQYWKNAGHSHESPDALCDYALRYWWLREHSCQHDSAGNVAESWSTHSDPESLDKAVDEEISKFAAKWTTKP
jgi:hypothetical protein